MAELHLRHTEARNYSDEDPEISHNGAINFSVVEPELTNDGSSESGTLRTANDYEIEIRRPVELENIPSLTEAPTKNARKRSRNPENWKQNVAKRQKNSGKAYVSSSGKNVEEKNMRSPCPPKCILSCFERFSERTRQQLFQSYWNLGSLQRQRDFLGSCIEPLQIKYRRVTQNCNDHRNKNCGFYLINNGERSRVCKKFIIKTLGITERTMRTVIQARSSGSGIIPEDSRGKHEKHATINEEILESVRMHLNSIPRIESHYLRANTSREFIDGGLNIAEIHRHYKTARASANKPAANYSTFAKIFNYEFNIGFYSPKKDQCDICVAYNNASIADREAMETSFRNHTEEKKFSRLEKNKDKDNSKSSEMNLIVAVYDLQAVLPIPMGQTSAFFYKSRLNCFNFTISELARDTNKCYFWHEGLGNRGVNEIGSCVLQYLEDVSVKHPGANVIFYSDNCGGQQKNRFMLSMYLYAVRKLDLSSIEHKFLIKGHTQNEGDCLHSLIEKAVKQSKKSGPIYVPDQYISLMRNAKKNGNPILVKEMNFTDFMNIKELNSQQNFNCTKNMAGEKIKFSECKMFRFVKASDVFFYKTTFMQEQWEAAPIKLVGTRLSNRLVDTVSLKPIYASKIPISEHKKNDLVSLLNSNLIPSYYEPFFRNLFD